MWLDTHCHLDAPEFVTHLGGVIEAAAKNQVQGILLPAVKSSDAVNIRKLVAQYAAVMPGLVYTLGIHPLYVERSTQADLDLLATEVKDALRDPRFVGIGEIGLDYFVEGLDRTRQAYFFEQQLDLAQAHDLPVVMHVRRSQDAILKALRQRRIRSGIAHAFNGSMQQAEQFIQLGFKLGFGGAATYTRALQIRRLATQLPLSSIVTETDAPDIPPAWLRDEGIAHNAPQFIPRIGAELANLRQMDVAAFAAATWSNALTALPRWSATLNPLNSN
jgi:TatD DNase family protein